MISLNERRDSGFKKIKEDYHNAVNYRPELEPKFYSDISSFIVTLYNLNYNVPVEKVSVGPDKNASEVFQRRYAGSGQNVC